MGHFSILGLNFGVQHLGKFASQPALKSKANLKTKECTQLSDKILGSVKVQTYRGVRIHLKDSTVRKKKKQR